MTRVEFRPSGKIVSVHENETIADAARKAGVIIDLPCGGKGTCGRCLVRVVEGNVEQLDPPPEGSPVGMALACRTKAGSGSCVIEAVERDLSLDDRFIESETADRPFPFFDPDSAPVRKITLEVAAPAADDGLSDIDRTGRELARHLSSENIRWSLSSMRDLPAALRSESAPLRTDIFYYSDDNSIDVIVARPAGSGTMAACAVIDLGTTTVQIEIYDLISGIKFGGASGYNDQIYCGEDVISRVNYALRPGGLSELRERALASINRLIRLAASGGGFEPEDILFAVISGNTIMTHLLCGIIPEYLRLEPYTPAVLSVPVMSAVETGIDIYPSAVVCLSPSVGSYVGGDITAGVLCTEINDSDDIMLFIDVGTNGEIVMGNREFLMTCACSAGPAFEGGGIGIGMRAMDGAVNGVTVDPDSGTASIKVIGGGRARGICGSGMIDLVSELFLKGVIDRSGRFNRDGKYSAVATEGRRARYMLVSAADSFTGAPLYITEQDIENIMRAKAAVYSACSLLLSRAGVGFQDISRVYVAGGFGLGLSVENAVTIGLLPDLPGERFSYIGNASLEGSARAALSGKFRKLQSVTAARMTYINLSTEGDYSEQYSAALFLPHTDMKLFPSVLYSK